MHPDPPLKQIIAELVIRGSIGAFAHSFWDLEMQSGSRVPPGPCFLYGNHSNNFDPFLVNLFTDIGTASSGVMTMEYLESGPLAVVFRSLGLEGTRKRVPEPYLIRRIYRMLEAGRRVLIYPEGGRRWNGRPGSWIESTAKLFHRVRVPVYPVITHASYVSWPRWARWPRPANVQIEVLPAVDLTNAKTTEEAIEYLSGPISFDENTVPEELRPQWAWRPAEGIERLLYRDPLTRSFGGLKTDDGRNIVGPEGRTRWTMLPDSRLRDSKSGRILTTADVYDTICTLPIEPDSEGVITRALGDVRWLEPPPRAHRDRSLASPVSESSISGKRGADIVLREEDITVGTHRVKLSEIDYIGLERNDKIWIMQGDQRCEIHLQTGGSVLGLYDTMLRLAPTINPGEVRPAPFARPTEAG